MIGVCCDRLRWRIRAAVSNPSIAGILTSIKMRAKSSLRRERRASTPERAFITFTSNVFRTSSSASRLLGWSSTRRRLTRGAGA